MGSTQRMSNGEAKIIGPHPSTIRVSASYMTQAAIDKRLAPDGLDAQERSLAEAREDTVRLQGVAWLDNVRRELQLPVKTFTTAVVYYHKFRLAHPKEDYQWVDAAAASLLTSCKNEDTLKKSRDILAAAYNMKLPGNQEQAATDDPMFETQSRMVIGIERLILESGGFDFRSRAPHHTLVKIAKSLPPSADLKDVSQLAWTVMTDLHRTFAPLKQTSSTLALASLELAAHLTAAKSGLHACIVRDNLQQLNLSKWHTTREEVMETLLDALDLYTHNTASSILGSKYSLDDWLRIRLAFNKECSDASLPRYTVVQSAPSPDNANDTGNTLRVSNGHPTPVSPPQPGAQVPQPVNAYSASSQHTPQTDGTLRFMLNPQRATEERAEVHRYYTEEWEEYEEEIEVPLPPDPSRERDGDREAPPRRDRDRDRARDRDRDRDVGRPRDFDARRNLEDRAPFDSRTERASPRAPPPAREPKVARPPNPSNMLQSVVRAPSPAPEILVPKDDDKDSQWERDRDSDRARDRPRSRDRDRRHDDRRHEGRDRYDSRRDRSSRDDRDRTSGGGSRRHYDDDRRRDRR
jgi:CTD kinase subunit beta